MNKPPIRPGKDHVWKIDLFEVFLNGKYGTKEDEQPFTRRIVQCALDYWKREDMVQCVARTTWLVESNKTYQVAVNSSHDPVTGMDWLDIAQTLKPYVNEESANDIMINIWKFLGGRNGPVMGLKK